MVELEFRFEDGSYPFVAGSAAEDCTFELATMIPRPGGRFAEFFSVTDADPSRIEALAEAHDDVTVTLLPEYDNGGLFEFHVAGSCPAYRLGELGALPQEVSASDGEGGIVADVPARTTRGASWTRSSRPCRKRNSRGNGRRGRGDNDRVRGGLLRVAARVPR